MLVYDRGLRVSSFHVPASHADSTYSALRTVFQLPPLAEMRRWLEEPANPPGSEWLDGDGLRGPTVRRIVAVTVDSTVNSVEVITATSERVVRLDEFGGVEFHAPQGSLFAVSRVLEALRGTDTEAFQVLELMLQDGRQMAAATWLPQALDVLAIEAAAAEESTRRLLAGRGIEVRY